MNTLDNYIEEMLPAIEQELKDCVQAAQGTGLGEYWQMLAYHLGWEGEGAGIKAQGKRVRPMMVLLTTSAADGQWRQALPVAAAVELIHNFSLIHDDIQDDSPLRRGRPTLWKKWNTALAINAGDALFALAHMSLGRLTEELPPAVAWEAAKILPAASLTLTKGQYLDLSYEGREDLDSEDYWPMINGKTGALLAACTELGALVAGVAVEQRAAYRRFGELVGLAFQVYDDLLGIWGDAALTGKSIESDLLAGKKSLPVLYALQHDEEFASRWAQGPLTMEEIPALTSQLETNGVRDYTQSEADRLTEEALDALALAQPTGAAREALVELTHKLIRREA